MANKEQFELLAQGTEVWNKWRKENPQIEIKLTSAYLQQANLHSANLQMADLDAADLYKTDLSEANLNVANLTEADLSRANLRRANLRGANLHKADLTKANLYGADLTEANLTEANLTSANLSKASLYKASLYKTNLSEAVLNGADFNGADFTEANLTKANFTEANLTRANLSKATLYNASLYKTNLSEAVLNGANFNGVHLGGTIFTQIDLRKIYSSESVDHTHPSYISTDTIQISKGEIPEAFLRGCGLSDWEIEFAKLYKPELSNQEIIDINYKTFDLRANQSIQISPLFISYSHADAPFVEKLEPCLTEKGVRFWRDVHNATVGRLEKQIDLAMRQNPTVILILSENSTASDWVEHEARLARELEKEIGRDVLCPIALDDSWKSAKWPARLMEQIMEYNILDYSKWNDDKAFGQVFNKMISGLDMFYKPEGLK